MKLSAIIIISLCLIVKGYAWKPIFIGHRGGYTGVQNTVEAYTNGVEIYGYGGLECDVRVTKDGQYVICHDETTTSLGGSLTVANATLEELKAENLSQTRGGITYKGKICTVAEYLAICKKYNVIPVIELKWTTGINNNSMTNFPGLYALVESYGLQSKAVFLTSMKKSIEYIRTNYPGLKCQFLTGEYWANHFDWCVTWKVDPSIQAGYFDAETVRKFHNAGLQVAVWTVNSATNYSLYAGMGVYMMTCDYLDPSSMPALEYPNWDDMRLMSFNVRHCAGSDGVVDESKTADVILSNMPDVVAVQELDSCNKRSSKYQIAELSRLTGMNGSYTRTIAYNGGSYGIGILSKEKPVKTQKVPLPGKEARAMLVCEFKNFIFACTHLCHQEQENRISSFEIISEYAKSCHKPFFIAGDFNAFPTSSEIELFKKDFTILSDVNQYTYPANNPNRCIDYIAVYKASVKGKDVNLTDKAVINQPYVSDHRPIYVTMTWPLENTIEPLALHMETIFSRCTATNSLPGGFPARTNSPYNSAYQGTAIDGTIYTNDCSTRKLLAYPLNNSADTTILSYAQGSSSYGITCDDKNNLILSNDENSSTPNQIILYNTEEKTNAVVDFSLPHPGKTKYISASGNIFSKEGGYVYYYPNSQKYVDILKVKEGKLEEILSCGPLEVAGSDSYVLPIDNNPGRFFYQVKSKGIYLFDGIDQGIYLTQNSTRVPNLCATTGGVSFNLDDHHLLLHPSGTNFNGGFTIRDLSAGDSVLLSGPSLGDAGVKNISHAQFFKAEKLADNSILLSEYNYGNGIAVYHLYTNTTHIKSPVSTTPETVRIYPTLCSNVLNIESASPVRNATIYDVNGQKIKGYTFDSNCHIQQINVEGLHRGLYIIAIQNHSCKFVKN